VWDLRYASVGPINFHSPDPSNPYDQLENGYLAMPGAYKVSLSKFEDGIITEIVPAVSFNTKLLNADLIAQSEKKQLTEFCKKISELRRAVGAADSYRAELSNKMKYIKSAVNEAPQKLENLPAALLAIDKKLVDINTEMNGDATLAKREFETIPSINGRVGSMEYTLWNISAAPTQTFVKSYEIAASQFSAILISIKEVDDSIKKVEAILEQNNAPYTPGRLPNWKGK
jgi:chromosome segregation ATPase